MNPKSFSHLDDAGEAHMVDVGGKPLQTRVARATAELHCQPTTIKLLADQALPKGDVLAVARIAGIQAAKQTAALIPLCHSLPLDKVTVDFAVKNDKILITTMAKTHAKTGVEMEALTAASLAALTLYDMMKAVDKTMRIEGLQVVEKTKE
ncbi:MAG: cyclic pyranopterin monophosphate synthase MoaC [Chthoniobacterales bacterium]|nr:cyclic pyranopterin monophosphate synthase MoaC [Chthoniobacterales bacterium]